MAAEENTVHIGLISDTHGVLRPEALAALAGVALVIHAGDVGSPDVLARLREIAPVVAVRGNTDRGEWAEALPETEVAEVAGILVYVLHDLHRLDLDPAAAGFAVVVSGHSHKPHVAVKNGVTYVNPGSAGPRRFRLPVTVATMEVVAGTASVEIVTLMEGR